MFQEESFVKSVKALTLLYDGDISEDIIPTSTAVLVDPVQTSEPGTLPVEDGEVNAEETASVEESRSGEAAVVVPSSGESSEQIQLLNEQV